MSKMLVVLKREYLQVVKSKSFLIGIVLAPLFMIAIVILPMWLAGAKSSSGEKLSIIDQSGEGIGRKFVKAIKEYKLEDSDKDYYILKDLVEIEPGDDISLNFFMDSLRTQIIDQQLKYFLVIRPDAHLLDSNIYLVTNSDNFVSFSRFERKVSNVLSTMRLEASDINISIDSALIITRRIDLAVQDAKGEAIPFQIKYFSAIIFAGIIMGMILAYGQLVMRSVIEEKNSRIMEVLVSSVSPFQLMFGKVLGLGAATFTQVAVWVAVGSLIYSQKAALDISPSIDRILFNPVIVIFLALFLISGYILFSTLFALIGSMVNSEKEAQGYVMPISLVLVAPFILGLSIVQDPNSTLAIVLSMIPIMAPTMMMMRLVFIVPTLSEYSLTSGIVGEAIISLAIVVVTILGTVWLTAKIFRVGILMYGKRPTLPEIIRWVRH
jgi:ABC-2 type transport system permease protein